MSEGWKESIRERVQRRIEEGDIYEFGEDVLLVEPQPTEEPPIEVQGEPWGWTKPGAKPRGWRQDGRYDPDEDNPRESDG
jgi:hypothetical protein